MPLNEESAITEENSRYILPALRDRVAEKLLAIRSERREEEVYIPKYKLAMLQEIYVEHFCELCTELGVNKNKLAEFSEEELHELNDFLAESLKIKAYLEFAICLCIPILGWIALGFSYAGDGPHILSYYLLQKRLKKMVPKSWFPYELLKKQLSECQ